MARRRRHHESFTEETRDDAALTPDYHSEDDNRHRRRRERIPSSERSRRRVSWLPVFVVLFLAPVALAPNLIGWTPLKDWLIGWMTRDWQGKVTVETLSLGWLQPIRVGGLRITDSAGSPIVAAERVTSSNRLYQFLTGADLGNFEFVRPRVSLVLREGGSNLEDTLGVTNDEEPTASESSALPKLSISIVEGEAALSAASDPNPWLVQQINGRLQTRGKSALLGEVTAAVARGESHGTLESQFSIDTDADRLQFQDIITQGRGNELPLGFLAPILERFVGSVQLQGTLSGQFLSQLRGRLRGANVKLHETHVRGLRFASPRLMGADVLQLASLVANGEISHDDQGLVARQLHLESDVGKLTADGQLNWRQFQRLTETGQLLETSFQLDGRLDLARLARILPKTLQLYDDTDIESGSVVLQVSSRPQQDAARIVVNVDASNLVAVRGGQRLAWQQPLRFVSTVTQRDRQWALNEVLCESDFLNLRGDATLSRGQFQVAGDLALLMERLGQFIDVGTWRLQGKLAGQLGWQISSYDPTPQTATLMNQPLDLQGNFTITEPLISLPGFTPWREPIIDVKLAGRGAASPSGEVALDQGAVEVAIGAERITATLTRPLANLLKVNRWQANCILQGSLAKWSRHLRPFYDLTFLQTDGNAQIQAEMLLDHDQLRLDKLQYIIRDWHFDGYGLRIREQEVSGTGTVRYDLRSGQTLLQDLTMVCSTVAARGDQVTINSAPHWDVHGNVAFRADAHRVLEWYSMFTAPDGVQFFGEAEGVVQLSSNPAAIVGQIAGQINNLVAAQQQVQPPGQWAELLREPLVKFATVAKLSQDLNRLDLEGFQADASSGKLRADGSIADLADTMQLDLRGLWSPDWQRIQKLLDAYTYQMVRLAGRQDQAFAIRGPLYGKDPKAPWPPLELQGTTQVSWQRASVFLLPVDAAEVTVALDQGIAKIDSGVVPFSQGQVRLLAGLPLHEPQWVVRIPAGTIAENVTLTPEICRDWLKFVNPLLADVATAQGKISLETSGGAIPLDDLNRAAARGTVHLSQVTVGAGPMALKMIEAVETIRLMLRPAGNADPKDRSVWIRLDQQAIPFTVAAGRVYHEGMRMTMKDLTVRTSGSVGFDQSLNMVAEIPIADDWIKAEEWMQGLKGQVIRVPITGTVAQPRIDMQGIRELSLNLTQRTAANKLGGLINEQSERLQNKANTELEKLQNTLQDRFGGQLNKLKGDAQGGKSNDPLNQIRGLFGPPKKDQ